MAGRMAPNASVVRAYATLSESYLLMQRGQDGIQPRNIMQNGRVIADPSSVTQKVYAYFYYQLGDYVARHGTRTKGFVTLAAVSGQGAGGLPGLSGAGSRMESSTRQGLGSQSETAHYRLQRDYLLAQLGSREPPRGC